MTSIEILSYAKINLFLHIVGQKNNSYHLLETLFAKINLHDKITLTENNSNKTKLNITYHGIIPSSPSSENFTEDNLILKGVSWMINQYHGKFSGLVINLQKHIPIAAGLGGGSSNAAFTILALCNIWNISFHDLNMREIALKLGADLPFFLYSGFYQRNFILMSGIGENILAHSTDQKITTKDQKKYFLLLINPLKKIQTSSCFQQYQKLKKNYSSKLTGEEISNLFNSNHDITCLISSSVKYKNDLEAAAMTILPEISTIIMALKKQEGCIMARLSGSGATCFGIFATYLDLIIAYRKIYRDDWWFYYDQLC